VQLYLRDTYVVNKNSLMLKLKTTLFGHAKLCNYRGLQFYAFHCPVHGIAVDYVHGRSGRLDCQYCCYDHYRN